MIIPLLVFTEAVYHPPLWLQMSIWPLLTLNLNLGILPFIKRAAVGLMWCLKLKGDKQR